MPRCLRDDRLCHGDNAHAEFGQCFIHGQRLRQPGPMRPLWPGSLTIMSVCKARWKRGLEVSKHSCVSCFSYSLLEKGYTSDECWRRSLARFCRMRSLASTVACTISDRPDPQKSALLPHSILFQKHRSTHGCARWTTKSPFQAATVDAV